jgi:hypothetical protein
MSCWMPHFRSTSLIMALPKNSEIFRLISTYHTGKFCHHHYFKILRCCILNFFEADPTFCCHINSTYLPCILSIFSYVFCHFSSRYCLPKLGGTKYLKCGCICKYACMLMTDWNWYLV